LSARPIIDEERAYLVPMLQADVDQLRGLWQELDERAEAFFTRGGFARSGIEAQYKLNLRYPGQNWSLSVDVATVVGARDLSFVGDGLPAEMVERFHARHEAEYGHRRDLEPPEVTGVRLVISAPVDAPAFAAGLEAKPSQAVPSGRRRANLGRGFADTAIYRGPDLRPGDVVEAPGIIEETFTTIVVYPGWVARVDDAGDYQLDFEGE
jgi:N-methylhydantoinase A